MLSREFQDAIKKMIFKTRNEDLIELHFNEQVELKYGVSFLERVTTPKGPATVIGADNNYLWFWVDGDMGVSHWSGLNGNILNNNNFTLLEGDSRNFYPTELTNYLITLFKVSPNEIRNQIVIEKIPTEIKKMFTELDPSVLDSDEKVSEKLWEILQEIPIFFKKTIENFISMYEAIIIKSATTKQKTIIRNGEIRNEDTVIDEKLDQIRKILEFLANFFLALPYVKGEKLQYAVKEIIRIFAEFIYQQSHTLFNEDERKIYPLAFFILSGINDNDTLKKSCYLTLLDEKIRPLEFNLLEYSCKNPESFVKLFNYLYFEDLFFCNFLQYNIANSNLECKLESAKLYLMYGMANIKLGHTDLAYIFLSQSLKMLFNIRQLTQDFNFGQENKIDSLFEQFFSDDFVAEAFVTLHYFDNFRKMNNGQYYLAKATNDNISHDNLTNSARMIYAFLAYNQLENHCKKAKKKALSILLNGQALYFLEKLANANSDVALKLAKFDRHHNNGANFEKYLQKALDMKNPKAQFFYYQIYRQWDYLLASSSAGYKPALKELHHLADDLKSASAIDILGRMYYLGQGVDANYQLALKYLEQSKNNVEARYFAGKILISTSTQIDKAMKYFVEVAKCPNEKLTEKVQKFLNKVMVSKDTPLEVKYKAAYTLSKILYEGTWLIQTCYPQSANLATIAFNINPTKNDFLSQAFLDINFRKNLKTKVLLQMYITLFDQMGKKEQQNICNEIIAKDKTDVNEIILNNSGIRKMLTPKIQFNLLTTLLRHPITAEQIPRIIVAIIKEANHPEFFLDLLQKNQQLLAVLLEDKKALEFLSSNKLWLNFLNDLDPFLLEKYNLVDTSHSEKYFQCNIM